MAARKCGDHQSDIQSRSKDLQANSKKSPEGKGADRTAHGTEGQQKVPACAVRAYAGSDRIRKKNRPVQRYARGGKRPSGAGRSCPRKG